MEVILLVDVKGVGKKDQKITVSDGYANNFLIKKHLAVKVTPKSEEVLATQQENARIADENARIAAQELAEKLKDVTVDFTLKSNNGRVFGSISTKQVEEEMLKQFGYKIDRHKFIDKGPFNMLGIYQLKIELYKGVIGIVKVHIGEEK